MRLVFLLLFLSFFNSALCKEIFDVIEEEQTDLGNGFIGFHKAEIIGLHKTTANSQVIELTSNQPIFFYNLEIKLEKCVRNTDPYKLDDYALVTLTEYKPRDDAKVIFKGWIIASSISISTFEHPIYEIILKRCK